VKAREDILVQVRLEQWDDDLIYQNEGRIFFMIDGSEATRNIRAKEREGKIAPGENSIIE